MPCFGKDLEPFLPPDRFLIKAPVAPSDNQRNLAMLFMSVAVSDADARRVPWERPAVRISDRKITVVHEPTGLVYAGPLDYTGNFARDRARFIELLWPSQEGPRWQR